MGFSGGGGGGLNGVQLINSPTSGQIIEAISATQAEWLTGGGGPPTGAAGGDLGSTYPNPTVVGSHLASPLPLAQGGTAAGNAQAAINGLVGAVTAGEYLRGDGTNLSLAAIQAADVPVLNQSTTGNAATATTAAACSGNAATATAAGGLESATTTVVVSGATAPSNGQVLTATGGSAASWQTPSGGGGTPFLVATQYAPAVIATPGVSSTTMAAFDSTNITTGNFVAPASGRVVVTFRFCLDLITGTTTFGLAAHGTVTPIVGNEIALSSPTNITFQYADLTFLVTGLTGGNTYAFDLLGASSVNTTTSASIRAIAQAATVPSANTGGPVLITVIGA